LFRRLKYCLKNPINVKMNAPKPMPEIQQNQGDLEHQRANFVRSMEAAIPREVLDAIEYAGATTPATSCTWPEFITQTHGACYAS
jgi:hypothetical protein